MITDVPDGLTSLSKRVNVQQKMSSAEPVLIQGKSFWRDHPHLPMVMGKVFAENDEQEREQIDYSGICHKHDHPELVIVRGGTATHYFEGSNYPIMTGDVFCILDGQSHYFHDMNNLQLINIMYCPNGMRLPFHSLRKVSGFNAMFMLEPSYRHQHEFSSRLSLSPGDLAHIINLAESMFTEFYKKPAGYEAYLTGSLIKLILFLSRHYGQHSGKEASALLRIGNILSALEDEPEKPWTLGNMSELGGLSPANLILIFKQATGMTPLNYLIQLRIRQAMELLAGTQMSVTEIAFEVGFNDSNYFARQFKRINGMSASGYRIRSES